MKYMEYIGTYLYACRLSKFKLQQTPALKQKKKTKLLLKSVIYIDRLQKLVHYNLPR